MALSLTTAVKDKVAYRLHRDTYANMAADVKALIDGEGPSVLVELESYANWFIVAAGTGAAPDAWEAWFVDEIYARCVPFVHPDRVTPAVQKANRTRADALATYARLSPSYDPASTTEAFVYQMVNNRKYVVSHCARLKPPLFPDMAAVDSAWEEVHTDVWNRAKWNFRRAQVVMTITPTTFSAGTWSTGAKTITVGSPTFSASTTLGSYVVITGGTNANTREYPVVSATTTALTLASDIGATNGAADIEGFLVTVAFTGLESGDSFDGIATTQWYYTDEDGLEMPLRWLPADQFAARQTVEGIVTDRPIYFRTQQAGGATCWRFSPHPNTAYSVRGEVYTAQPADPSSGTSTTLFDKFAPEFLSTLRRAQLARVLTNHDRHNEQMAREVATAIESQFPEAQSAGDADARLAVTDVYGDWGNIPCN